jgi:ATP-dependent helicase/nuclease subunit A
MFKIVSSSAGSGKTYTLTKEYLKLILSSDEAWYYKRILAITFTKAATREMKERIMARLEAFADYKQQDGMLMDIIAELYPESLRDMDGAFALRKNELRRRAKTVFTNIIHNYSDFAVMTIDSFVQRIVSAFTEELGIPFSFEVEMEADELLLVAVERILEKVGDDTQTELSGILKDFYIEASQDGKNWHQLPETLATFARDLLNEQRYAAIQQNGDLSLYDFKKIKRQMVVFIKKIENRLVELGQRGVGIIESMGLDDKDFSYGTVPKYFRDRVILKKTLEEFQKREYDVFVEDKGWYTKTANRFVKDTIEEIKSALCDVASQIEELRTKNASLYYLYEQLLPHLYHLSLLNEIKTEFDRQLRENGKVHISEFNQKILKIVTEDPVPFIYERLGEKYNHILIDEFQDTSKLQFANLLPLIDNSLGYEHFNLAVGDSKQAIYRFRGGEMSQIVALHTQQLGRLQQSLGQHELTTERLQNIKRHLTADALTTNRRSARAIVEFNNDFFEKISDAYQSSVGSVKDVFGQDFKQLVPAHAADGGSVQIEFIDEKSDEDNPQVVSPMLTRTLDLIEEAQTKGFSVGDIAILCRKVKEAKVLANYLKEQGYAIISEDSLSLRFSKAVSLMTAFMQVLIKPDDRLHKYEAMYLFYETILHQTPNNQTNEQIKIAVESHNVHDFYDYINTALGINNRDTQTTASHLLQPYRLLQLSIYELAEQLILTFGLFGWANERGYLFRFLDVILEFGTKKGTDLNDFLIAWERLKDKVSISKPSDVQAITIQTIHRSKGLEYPVVIVPYCHWSFVPDSKRDTLWVDLEDSQELSLASYENSAGETIAARRLKTGAVPTRKVLQNTTAEVAQQYEDEVERTFMDNINLLYVAFTRPTQSLYILSKAVNPEKKDTNQNVGVWLADYLVQLELYDTEQSVYTLSSSPMAINTHRPTIHEPSILSIPTIVSNPLIRDLRLRRMADRVFDTETFERKKDHGNKVHYAMSLIKTPADVEAAIRQLLIEGLAEPSEAAEIKQSISKVFDNEELAGLFDNDNIVLNEREILTPDGKQHRPDRVVKLADKIVILDYKTGAYSDSHQSQLKRYTQLYREMGYANVFAKLVYLENNEVVDVA